MCQHIIIGTNYKANSTGFIFFLFFNQNICFGYSKEHPQWDGSFEHPKCMFKLMGFKKIVTILQSKSLLKWIYESCWAYQCLLMQSMDNGSQAFSSGCVTEKKFLFLNQNICCGCSKEPSQWDGSFEHPKHMLKIMGKKIFTILHEKFCLSKPLGSRRGRITTHIYGTPHRSR